MPGLFEQFPHTNLHELNLDWIIDMINQFKEELEDSAVLSVNGETGHVTLYESENVILPALPEDVDQWRLIRMMNGQNIGILFYNGNVWLQRGNTNLRLLTREDLPETGVLSWNGQTGVVTATGANIPRSTSDPTSIDEAITTETTERTNADNSIRNTINAISNILADKPQYANQMAMSQSDATTVAMALATLNTNLAPNSFTIAAGETVTKPFSVPSILCTGHLSTTQNLRGLYFIFGLSAIAPLIEATDLAVSVANGNITITNNASATCNCALIR